MIYIVTVNPALDYVMQLKKVNAGSVNRSDDYQFLTGSKGIDVSQTLSQLGVDNTTWGFVGGFTDKELIHQLNVKKIGNDFVTISDGTRVNVKVHTQKETEINTTGPKTDEQEITTFKVRLGNPNEGDIIILSGSLAPSLPTDFYEQLLPTIREASVEFAIDTTGEALLATLKHHPLVIKPNHHESAALFNTNFASDKEMLEAAKKLLDVKAQNVMISMTGDGAYLVTKDHTYHASVAVDTAVNSVGVGDSMTASFIGTYYKTHDVVEALKMGSACGGATAFTEDIAVKSQINTVLPQITVGEVK